MLVSDIDVLALDIDGVLTDGRVELTPAGEESKGIAFRDLDAIGVARRAGVRVALVTGEQGPLVDRIAERIGADHVIAGAKDKHAAMHALAAHLAAAPKSICFVGDADRDAAAFGCVGLGLAPADASARARARAHRVLEARGGAGAVAEAVDIVMDLRGAARHAPARLARLTEIVAESIAAHQRLLEQSVPAMNRVAEVLIRALRSGNKLMLCGNGGSAADAQHVAGEIVGRFARDSEPWPAMALTTDTSILTAVGNDWQFEEVFSRQVRAFARPGDVVAGISTSGNSANIVRALGAARERGAVTIAFTGAAGGRVADEADIAFRAPAGATPRIQELHILAWHGICEIVEAALCDEGEV
jgi:D-sedoheptulose 7-phosphate isomerase